MTNKSALDIGENGDNNSELQLDVSTDRKKKRSTLHRFKKRSSELHIKERRSEFCRAMSNRERIRTQIKCIFSKKSSKPNDSEDTTEGDQSFRQFTISRRKKKHFRNGFLQMCSSVPRGFFSFGSVKSLNSANSDARFGFLPNPNKVLIDFLNWMYSNSFFFLFFFCALFFYVFTIAFALIIMWIGVYQEQCINIGSTTYGTLKQASGFAGAFTLSWTTLSTVGYGNTSPSIEDENCISVNFLLMVESFIGVTYSGFCGAILFGKLMRFQSRATVIFSDPIVIRYGKGLTDLDGYDLEESQTNKNQPPVLEFRLLNLMHEEPGGEIMSAVLHVVASTHAQDNDPVIVQQLPDRSDHHKKSPQDESLSEYSDHPADSNNQRPTPRLKRRKRNKLHGQYNTPSNGSAALFDEGNDKLMPKINFSTLEIEEPQHPLFKRTWVGKHILNKDSPLLKENVKQRLRRNDNKWPDDLYDAGGIKNSLEFNQIIVSITGVSNVSGSDVYAHNIYQFNDVVIGFEFVDILVYEKDTPKVDIHALHCVVEQVGGGCETIDALCCSHHESL